MINYQRLVCTFIGGNYKKERKSKEKLKKENEIVVCVCQPADTLVFIIDM